MGKRIFGLCVAAILVSASFAFADCFTRSNGLVFTGSTPQDAVYGCQTTLGTDAYECQVNVRCDVDPYPPYPGPHPGPFPGPHPGPHHWDDPSG